MKISSISTFTKSAKKLAKKYKKLAHDLEALDDELQNGAKTAINLGDDFYKIRLKNSSIPQGKSSGFRVVYFFKTKNNEIYLLDIYTENIIENINKDKLLELVQIYDLL
ncbi:conserved hypothetical protein [Isorropodon fossajaponicum endosymbiont JTNG4]|uniref:hypothetical protein n=1 Tax=Isorropodon fossajaponicum symbiont TaxID=883811 RepID=UPI001916385D|nr:hypothetical protein [Isorropodon fossajaponicum symbiont]BBB23939.1 conserved hypothetical protein [Isorropodon fossajaponicum endosymbiont JTNG4]